MGGTLLARITVWGVKSPFLLLDNVVVGVVELQ
jgi:hypothetical protein